MASLKEVRVRIASVNSTKQITSAMKMVSASKLRKAQTSLLKLRPYAAQMNQMMLDLCGCESSKDIVYLTEREPEKILVVVVASNRGLCGAFNTNTFKAAQKLVCEQFPEQYSKGTLEFLCVGRKASEYFSKRGYKIAKTETDILDNVNYENASAIAVSVMKDFEDAKYDRVFVVYNKFVNAAVQKNTVVRYLPTNINSQKQQYSSLDYILEPDKKSVISELVPRSLRLQFYEFILNSVVSEHGARMTAMHKATDNATELLKDLKLSYNKVRQASITREILEIVGGANALV